MRKLKLYALNQRWNWGYYYRSNNSN